MAARKGPKEWEPRLPDIEHDMVWCLAIRAPEWFAREDFQGWRRRARPATWDEKRPEGQDVFLVWADGELDWHTEGLPRDIERSILRLIRDQDMDYGVVWIKAA